VGSALRVGRDRPLLARIAGTAALLTGAERAVLYLREKGGWASAATLGSDSPVLSLPEPCPEQSGLFDGRLWVRLEAEGSCTVSWGSRASAPTRRWSSPSSWPPSSDRLSARTASRGWSRKRTSKSARRLLELESLYDLGLSLAGQLDLAALADEVLFRSISLTDARKGSLVLLSEKGAVLLSRHIGGELVSPRQAATWALPQGVATVNNQRRSFRPQASSSTPVRSASRSRSPSPGGASECWPLPTRNRATGSVLDFTSTDARLLSLFANQAAAAIETARLHGEAIEKERIERELELAAAIQREILPRSLPSIPGLELAAANVPTRQVGGDYYDLFPLSEGRLGFLVADVSGKGVPAALLVSTVHSAVHLQIDEAKTISDLVARIDRHLRRFAATRKFLTLFFGVIEPDTGRLRYVSAGHNPALVARANGRLDRLDSTGIPVGMLPGASWREETVELQSGDLLCVYTDGVTEAVNERDEEFGLERLSEIVGRGARRPVRELCDSILSSVADFAQGVPQYDDQTLLLARRT
jgi:sigma-B regulation protein RsbU (phosphoserine phosphatase)